MTNLSTKTTSFLILFLLLASLTRAADRPWPTEEAVDIYHSFGDFRSNRYHAGLDIRTGGKPGRKIYSPVDGYVYRVKMAYNGYGKGLYIMGDDGLIYVFGHLQVFQPRIDSSVKAIQIATERYFMDKYYPKDSLRIKAGEFIAKSGQTGAGAPHIHFEVRKTEGQTVNPLLAGFTLNDKTKPTLERIGFQYIDDHSLFQNGQRNLYLPLKSQKHGDYTMESVPYLSRPFGFLIDAFDQSRYNGIKQAVYSVKLTIDGTDQYEIRFDSLEFETGRSVNLNFDYAEASQGRKRVRRLFKLPGNDFARAIAYNDRNGIITFDTTERRIVSHEVAIRAEDVYGNTSVARIDLLGGPSPIFRLDSTVILAWDSTYFYFEAPGNIEALGIDSIVPYMNSQDQWGRVKNAEVFPMPNGDLKVEALGGAAETSTMRLVIYTERGIVTDKQFSGQMRGLPKRPDIEWEIIDGGISVKVSAQNLRSSLFYLRMFDGEKLLGALEPVEVVTMREYLYFIPADVKYDRITLLELSMKPESEVVNQMQLPVNFHLIGDRSKETSAPDGRFIIKTDERTTYGLNYIALEMDDSILQFGKINSPAYTIKPDFFLTRKSFDITLTMDSSVRWPDRTGICWLDESDSSWVWLNDNRVASPEIHSKSQGGGKFLAIVDRYKPTVKNINIRSGIPVRDSRPQLKFEIEDKLSGIATDTSISIHIDDQWLIPEYDPETGLCFSRPYYPLAEGDHVLHLAVTDRAGNTSRQKIRFKVQTTGKK